MVYIAKVMLHYTCMILSTTLKKLFVIYVSEFTPEFWCGPCCAPFQISVLCFCALFFLVLYLVCTMLLVSLDFPFLIVPSGFSNVYLEQSKTENCRCRDIIDILLRHICMTDYSWDLVQEPQCNVAGFKTSLTGLNSHTQWKNAVV